MASESDPAPLVAVVVTVTVPAPKATEEVRNSARARADERRIETTSQFQAVVDRGIVGSPAGERNRSLDVLRLAFGYMRRFWKNGGRTPVAPRVTRPAEWQH